jgi:acetyl-CoA C-acetyltransferase
MTDAYIYDHVRTPRGRGRSDGALHEITPVQLGAQVLSAVKERNALDTSLIDDIVMGVVSPIGEQGSVLPRLAALAAGFEQAVPGMQLNRMCGSGLEAVNIAAASVMAGQADAVIAGGVEMMSRVPLGSDGGAWHTDPAFASRMQYIPQGVSADLIATLDGWTRDDLDKFALASQQRAGHAWSEGYFSRSVISVRDILGDPVLTRDEHPRPQTTLADLGKLKPAFRDIGERDGYDGVALLKYPQVSRIEHNHTGGNSSGVADGASALLVGSLEYGRKAALKPLAKIRGYASVGGEPTIMLTAPDAATRKVLRRTGLSLHDVDLFEVNEAFAAVVLRFMRATGVLHDKINVNGGSIAMGHPLGATGAMLVGTVLDELQRRDLNTALITLCIGVGMGVATVIERV